MKRLALLLVGFLACGCIGGETQKTPHETTTTTVEDVDFTYYMPTTTSTEPTNPPTTLSEPRSTTTTTLSKLIKTFKDNGGEICKVDGKPIVRMYSKTDCEHCTWSGPIFDNVVGGYVGNGSIVAHHWFFDRNDDVLTDFVEGVIPKEEYTIFEGGNMNTVPYFSFGCRFTRTGNGYYVRNLPGYEGGEFRAVIEQILSD
ncbi:MAG: hypothetical protein V1744_00305 [Candidatus Altiarchaeota archaeon]